ncbi:MAG: hypothetical protein WA979_07955 [Pacificimonas sp.]
MTKFEYLEAKRIKELGAAAFRDEAEPLILSKQDRRLVETLGIAKTIMKQDAAALAELAKGPE